MGKPLLGVKFPCLPAMEGQPPRLLLIRPRKSPEIVSPPQTLSEEISGVVHFCLPPSVWGEFPGGAELLRVGRGWARCVVSPGSISPFREWDRI